jgi:hypothetical protein
MATNNIEPGMDDPQAAADRKGYQTTVDMVTGKGMVHAANDGGGPEVGNQYDADPMGEEYGAVTYPKTTPDWGGSGTVAPGATMPRKTSAGNEVASAPQNRGSAK